MNILTEEIRKANKEHHCLASYWWCNSNFGEGDVSPCDWKIIKSAEADRFKILKGENYLYQTFVYHGTIHTFKARLDMHNICCKYDLYPDRG